MLESVKRILGIADESRDTLLELLISNATARLKVLLGGVDEVPDSLSYIVIEVTVMRYNRIGSEGISSHTVEGEDITYIDNDFDAFADDIDAYLEEQASSKRGRVRFL